jgi:hypothetical protein
MIVNYLVRTYGKTTPVDTKNARDKLQTTSWNERDTIDTFTHRFMQRLSIYNDSVSASKHKRHTIYTDDEVTMLYLQLLATTMPNDYSLYNAIQEMYSKYELEMEEFDQINIHVSYIQRKLQRLVLTQGHHIHNDRSTVIQRSRRSFNRPPSSLRQTVHNRHRHQANTVLQSQKYNHFHKMEASSNVSCSSCLSERVGRVYCRLRVDSDWGSDQVAWIIPIKLVVDFLHIMTCHTGQCKYAVLCLARRLWNDSRHC